MHMRKETARALNKHACAEDTVKEASESKGAGGCDWGRGVEAEEGHSQHR